MSASSEMNPVRPRRLRELLRGVAEVSDTQDRNVKGLSMDSRSVRAGDLFFACAGQREHGGTYIENALSAGAIAVLWEPSARFHQLPPPLDDGDIKVPFFVVEGLQEKIGVIADRFYGHPSRSLHVIGITGTDGKTSCAQFLGAALDQGNARCGVIGTLGYGLYGEQQSNSHTTPDPIRVHGLMAEMREKGAGWVVMEVSSHGLEQGRVNGVAFDIAVLTQLSRDHLDYHGDEQAYAKAKQRLFEVPGLGAAVLNLEDAFGRSLVSAVGAHTTTVGYGFGPVDVSRVRRNVIGSDLRMRSDGMTFNVDTSWGVRQVRSTLLGRFNASNLLAVLSALLVSGVSLDEACEQIEALEAVPGRMERFGAAGHPTVVVDYAHTPDALRHVLTAARPHCGGALWVVFGCGGDRDRGKRPLMGAVAEEIADRVIVTDDNPRTEDPQRIIEDILRGVSAPESVVVERDRRSAIRTAIAGADPTDLVVVAGKGHETYQLVGDRRLEFSDRDEIRSLLAEISS